MHATLRRRLDRIEKAIPKRAALEASVSVAPLIAERLAALGIVRRPEESLAEATARAMGISLLEFRKELMRLAHSRS